jgi:hypothetical protein
MGDIHGVVIEVVLIVAWVMLCVWLFASTQS